MTYTPYENKAAEMFEVAMEDVRSDVNQAWKHAEILAEEIGKIADGDLRDTLDEQLSYIMLYLEKI